MLQTITILGVKVTNENKENILKYLFQQVKEPRKKLFITTPNPEMVMYAHGHPDYQNKLNHADVALPDGIGLFFAARLLGIPLQERITGVDFIEELCKLTREKPLSMGFLGGKGGVAKRAAECLMRKYPWIKIGFVGEEWPQEIVKSKNLGVKNKKLPIPTSSVAHQSQIDILFVALGVPKQEEWIYKNLQDIPVSAAMGVGGAFDFISGKTLRAPFIVRFLGLEWLFRLVLQPWRWKRQLALLEFIFLVLKEKFSR